MKRSMFRLLTVCLFVIATMLMAGSLMAQGKGKKGGDGGGGDPPPASPFNYRLEYVDFHLGNNGLNGAPDDIAMINDGLDTSLFIVGRSRVNGEYRAFVYDHQDKIFNDVPTLLGSQENPPRFDENTWVASICRAISSNGIVVGGVKDVDGTWHGYWFNLLATKPTLNLLETNFPEIVDGSAFYAKDVNANGEVLVSGGWVVNIQNGTSHQLPPEMVDEVAINDLGDVIGEGENSNDQTAIRYNIHTEILPEVNPKVIEGLETIADINNLGEFCGYDFVNVRKNRYTLHAFRWGNGEQHDWLSDPSLASRADSLNDSGDVTGQTAGFPYNAFFHYAADGQTYLVKDLVDDAYLNAADLAFVLTTERDSSLTIPAPIIVGNAEGETDEKIFILVPEELP